jgi:adenylate cyclase
MLGRFEEAITETKKALHRDPDFVLAHLRLAIIYAHMGKEVEAREAAAEIHKVNPGFSAENWAKMVPYKNKKDLALVMDGLRKAGLME